MEITRRGCIVVHCIAALRNLATCRRNLVDRHMKVGQRPAVVVAARLAVVEVRRHVAAVHQQAPPVVALAPLAYPCAASAPRTPRICACSPNVSLVETM